MGKHNKGPYRHRVKPGLGGRAARTFCGLPVFRGEPKGGSKIQDCPACVRADKRSQGKG
jgi:hypothetical protein